MLLEYTITVTARRVTAHGSIAGFKDAQIVLDSDVAGWLDAFDARHSSLRPRSRPA